MSYRRHNDKPDQVTQQIVDELRALHFDVLYIGRPVDLAVRAPGWPLNTWMLMEVKRPANKKGSPRLDKRQKDQAAFCAAHGVPYVTCTEQVLEYTGQSPR